MIRGFHPDAVVTIGAIGVNPESTSAALGRVLSDPDPAVARAAVQAMARFGPAAAGCVPRLAAAIPAALLAESFEVVNEAVQAVAPDMRAAVRTHVTDPERRRQAAIALTELGLG